MLPLNGGGCIGQEGGGATGDGAIPDGAAVPDEAVAPKGTTDPPVGSTMVITNAKLVRHVPM